MGHASSGGSAEAVSPTLNPCVVQAMRSAGLQGTTITVRHGLASPRTNYIAQAREDRAVVAVADPAQRTGPGNIPLGRGPNVTPCRNGKIPRSPCARNPEYWCGAHR